MCYITGPLSALVDLETIFLQRIGPACVAAYNSYNMCMELPEVGFLAMDARHCAGSEMAELMAYGASVGAAKARAKANAVGFIVCYRLNSAFLWSRKGRWHYAPRLDWLCRINRACRRNVP